MQTISEHWYLSIKNQIGKILPDAKLGSHSRTEFLNLSTEFFDGRFLIADDLSANVYMKSGTSCMSNSCLSVIFALLGNLQSLHWTKNFIILESQNINIMLMKSICETKVNILTDITNHDGAEGPWYPDFSFDLPTSSIADQDKQKKLN